MGKRKIFVALGTAPLLIVAFLVAVVVASVSGFAGGACAMPMDTPEGAVRVMTWNVWGEVGESEGHPMKDRAPYMVERVQTVRPDILMMQEAGASHRGPWFRKYMQENTGLTPVGTPKLGKKPRKIWINPATLELESAGSWIIPMGPGHKNVTWAKLRSKSSGDSFYALSVHLDHRKSKNGLRGDQMTWILNRVKKANTSDLPVVIGGDLNTNKYRSGNAPVSILKDRGYVNTLDAAETKPVNDDMVSALGPKGTKTLKVAKKDHAQIDYIWASKGSSAHSWALVPQAPISEGRYTRLTSDHNAIAATVTPGGTGATNALGQPRLRPASATISTSTTASKTWTSAQRSHASSIVAAGKTMGISARGRTIAVMVGIVDNNLGSIGWVSKFYSSLADVGGWETMTPATAAKRAGAAGSTAAYAKQFKVAQDLVDDLSGSTPQATEFADQQATTDACSPDGLNMAWSDGTDCHFENVHNPRTCQQALAAAAKIARDQPCKNVVRGGNWDNRCLEFVGRVYGYYAAGSYTAYDHYKLLKRKGLVKTTRDIPAGALVFFTTGNPAGHVAIYAGNGKAYSNDYVRQGCIDLTPMSTMSRGGRFLGWSPPVFPNGSRL